MTVDWEAAFTSDVPIELFLRGSLMYLALFVLLRVVLKRQEGAIGTTDLLVVVLIADAAQSGMADDYTSVIDGLVLVSTIVGWSFALDWLGYRIPWFQRLIRPRPLPLVREGRLLRRHLRQELITDEELMSQLRLQGCDDLAKVKVAYINGRRRPDQRGPPRRERG